MGRKKKKALFCVIKSGSIKQLSDTLFQAIQFLLNKIELDNNKNDINDLKNPNSLNIMNHENREVDKHKEQTIYLKQRFETFSAEPDQANDDLNYNSIPINKSD